VAKPDEESSLGIADLPRYRPIAPNAAPLAPANLGVVELPAFGGRRPQELIALGALGRLGPIHEVGFLDALGGVAFPRLDARTPVVIPGVHFGKFQNAFAPNIMRPFRPFGDPGETPPVFDAGGGNAGVPPISTIDWCCVSGPKLNESQTFQCQSIVNPETGRARVRDLHRDAKQQGPGAQLPDPIGDNRLD
jgi:hypothetical protein